MVHVLWYDVIYQSRGSPNCHGIPIPRQNKIDLEAYTILFQKRVVCTKLDIYVFIWKLTADYLPL